MKKILLFALILNGLAIHSQIVLENSYASGGLSGSISNGNLQLVKLSTSGYKYVTKTLSNITLYNLNHSVFKTISTPTVPALTCTACALNIWFISEQLFDNNPATVEYLWLYNVAGGASKLKIINETGTVLFSKDSVTLPGGKSYGAEEFISYTTSGVKMILYTNSNAVVYSLPGVLSCHECSSGTISGYVSSGGVVSEGSLSNYPNPSSEQTTIEYELPKGTSKGEIVIYSISGNEVKRFQVTDAFHNIIINTSDLSAATYYYQLQTQTGYKTGKKMVVIK